MRGFLPTSWTAFAKSETTVLDSNSVHPTSSHLARWARSETRGEHLLRFRNHGMLRSHATMQKYARSGWKCFRSATFENWSRKNSSIRWPAALVCVDVWILVAEGCSGYPEVWVFQRGYQRVWTWIYELLSYTVPYDTIICYTILLLYYTYAMLCYATAMLCYAMLCHAMLCYAMLCDAMPCHAMPCHAMLCYAILL